MIIIHIIEQDKWEVIRHQPVLLGQAFADFGFVHCCFEEQVHQVIQQWFPKENSLLAVEIDTEKLSSPLVLENLEGGEEKFPHIYGPINRDAIIGWRTLKAN